MGELVLLGGQDRQIVIVRRTGVCGLGFTQPEVMEVDAFHINAVRRKRVDIAIANPAPVYELDAQLEGRVGFEASGPNRELESEPFVNRTGETRRHKRT